MRKIILTTLLSLLVVSCGGGGSGSPAGGASNNKTVYFENDFVSDSSLVASLNDVAVFQIDHATVTLDDRIPFAVESGDFDLCVGFAAGILGIRIKNSLDELVVDSRPSFSVDCKAVTLAAGTYYAEPYYVSKPLSYFQAPVPNVRVNINIEKKSDLDIADWDASMAAEASRGGATDGGVPQWRHCYDAPNATFSYLSYSRESNKILFNLRADLTQGFQKLCTHVPSVNPFTNSPAVPQSAGDIGDIDEIIASFIESANSSLESSAPDVGAQYVSVASKIKVKFIGTIDVLSVDSLFSIIPETTGQLVLNGQEIEFTPDSNLQPDTSYQVKLTGLFKDGVASGDIHFGFKTEKQISFTGNETSLPAADLCALGIQQYCTSSSYAEISAITAAMPTGVIKGSQYLNVTTQFNKQNNSDVLIDYEVIDTRDDGVLFTGSYVALHGEQTYQDTVSLPDDWYNTEAFDVKVVITKVSNSFAGAYDLGTWPVLNGEFYSSQSQLDVGSDASVVSDLSIAAGTEQSFRMVTVTLDNPAVEDVNVVLSVVADVSGINGFNLSYGEPVLKFVAGEQQKSVEIKPLIYDAQFGWWQPYTGSNYVSNITLSVSKARNTGFDAGYSINDVISIVEPEYMPVASDNSVITTINTAVADRLSVAVTTDLEKTYSIVTQPDSGSLTLDSVSGIYQFTPALDMNGIVTFDYKVTNGFVDSNVATISVNVSAINAVPIAISGSLAVTEDIAASGTLSAIDSNGSTLTYALVDSPSKGIVNITNANTGAYTYTPNLNENGVDSFSFKASDVDGVSNTATILIDIAPVNDVPVSQNSTLTINEDEWVSGQLVVSDADNDTLIISTVSSGSKGYANISNDGSYVYRTNANQNGSDSFSYKVFDSTTYGAGIATIYTVSVDIVPVPDAPRAFDSTETTQKDVVLNGQVNATDGDGDSLSYSAVTLPSLGMLSFDAATGSFVYTPNAGESGFDSFTYQANDGVLSSNIGTVNFVIFDQPLVPMSQDGAISVAEDAIANGTLVAFEPDGDNFTYAIVSPPALGSVTVNSTSGNYVYTPNENANGVDSFTFNATDKDGTSNTATITVTVLAVEDLPLANNASFAAIVGEPLNAQLDANDVDGDTIAYSVVAQPTLGQVNLNTSGAFTYTSATNTGADSFSYKVTDGKGDSNTATVTIDVSSADNTVPIASNVVLNDSTAGNVVVGDTLSVTYNFSDADNDLEATPVIRWLRNGVEIPDQITADYKITSADSGQSISAEVKPVAVTGRVNGVAVVSNALPVANLETTLNISADLKTLKFNWQPTLTASYYRLFENPDGVSGFTQLGGDLTTTNYDLDVSVHLHNWVNARYMLQVCDDNDFCIDSNEVSALNAAVSAIGYLKASNTRSSLFFGLSLDISADGNTLVVGTAAEDVAGTGINGYQLDTTGHDSGAVYVFSKTVTGWAQQAYIKSSNSENYDRFGGSVSISADGNTLAVGAIDEDSVAAGINGDQTDNTLSGSGAVYIFSRSGESWIQTDYLKASNPDAFDRFGIKVSLSDDGNNLAVSSRNEDSAATGINGDELDNSAADSGAVYVFKRSLSIWSQTDYLKASNTEAADNFGSKIEMSADGLNLVVSASSEDSTATGINGNQSDNAASASGAVYVFTNNADVWSQQAYIKASNTDVDDVFGNSIAISANGDVLAVAAYKEDSVSTGIENDQTDNSAQDSGAVYLFNRNIGSWSQQAYIKASNAEAGDLFGVDVALNATGNLLVVGAYGEDGSGTGIDGNPLTIGASGSGAVYVFEQQADNWSQRTYLKAPNTDAGDSFGAALAINADGSTISVGAVSEGSQSTGIGGDQTDNNTSGSGAVYLY